MPLLAWQLQNETSKSALQTNNQQTAFIYPFWKILHDEFIYSFRTSTASKGQLHVFSQTVIYSSLDGRQL